MQYKVLAHLGPSRRRPSDLCKSWYPRGGVYADTFTCHHYLEDDVFVPQEVDSLQQLSQDTEASSGEVLFRESRMGSSEMVAEQRNAQALLLLLHLDLV